MASKIKLKRPSSMTHDDLVEIGRKWLLRPWRNADCQGHSACCLVITEMTHGQSETPDVIGWSGMNSILLEAKVSREDFLGDKKKYFRRYPEEGMGKQRYFIVPKGLVREEELPEGWGLIEVSDEGKTRVRRASGFFNVAVNSLRSELSMMLSLLRRLKFDPDKSVAIRGYTIERDREPRASFTVNECEEN